MDGLEKKKATTACDMRTCDIKRNETNAVRDGRALPMPVKAAPFAQTFISGQVVGSAPTPISA